MKKIILDPGSCGDLCPNYPVLDHRKLLRLRGVKTRPSSFSSDGHRTVVMSPPPILVTDDGFILNGKHRALKALVGDYRLEACCIDGIGDLRYHTPHVAYGGTDVETLARLYSDRNVYRGHCGSEGIHCIRDFTEPSNECGMVILEHITTLR